MLRISVHGIGRLTQALGAQTKAQKKALATAIKVEGYRQLRHLRNDIRAGHPGGHVYSDPLSKIAGRTQSGARRKNPIPLFRLARLLRYQVTHQHGDIQFDFGFVDTTRRPLPASYKQLVLRHEEGMDVLYSGNRTALGRRLARIGGKLKKKGDPDAKYFFLRKTTGRKLSIPKRSMVPAFWQAHAAEAGRHIVANFKRKMRGERI